MALPSLSVLLFKSGGVTVGGAQVYDATTVCDNLLQSCNSDNRQYTKKRRRSGTGTCNWRHVKPKVVLQISFMTHACTCTWTKPKVLKMLCTVTNMQQKSLPSAVGTGTSKHYNHVYQRWNHKISWYILRVDADTWFLLRNVRYKACGLCDTQTPKRRISVYNVYN